LSIEGRKMAIDVTVVSTDVVSDEAHVAGPTRANARLSHMDAATKTKNVKYGELCAAANWDFSTFVCDTYGATTSDARAALGLAVRRLKPDDHPGWGLSPIDAVWRSLSAAIISRAAEQYTHAMEHYVHLLKRTMTLVCFKTTVW
jgi:hypothetical protein